MFTGSGSWAVRSRFDWHNGFSLVGQSLSLTLASGRTRKSFELIFIFLFQAC
jgi:hypothetical protein